MVLLTTAGEGRTGEREGGVFQYGSESTFFSQHGVC